MNKKKALTTKANILLTDNQVHKIIWGFTLCYLSKLVNPLSSTINLRCWQLEYLVVALKYCKFKYRLLQIINFLIKTKVEPQEMVDI